MQMKNFSQNHTIVFIKSITHQLQTLEILSSHIPKPELNLKYLPEDRISFWTCNINFLLSIF
jgi:hypothetical protein